MLGFFIACILIKYDIIEKGGNIMKILFNILVVVGLFLLISAVLGRFMGNRGVVVGLRLINIVLLANTTLLLAIVVKLFEKK